MPKKKQQRTLDQDEFQVQITITGSGLTAEKQAMLKEQLQNVTVILIPAYDRDTMRIRVNGGGD